MKYVSFVYFISDGEFIKIGKANNVELRLKQLQTANARKLTVLKTIPFITEKDAFDTEQFLQVAFAEHSICDGEWFHIEALTLNKALNQIEYVNNSFDLLTSTIKFFKNNLEEKILNRPTYKVYQDYENYCDKYNMKSISHGEFSKQVKKYYGFTIKNKKIQGKKYRIFVKEGENDGN